MSQTTSPAVPSIPLSESPVEVQWPVAPQPQPRPKRVAAQRTRQRKRVPHTLEITSKRNSSFSEYFKLDGALGVPVRGILDDTVVPDGHDERILERTGVRQIRLVVAWPGYAHTGTYIQVQDKGEFITRARLAKLICAFVSRFLEKPPNPEWALRSARGRRRISVDNLWLVRVALAQKNIWLADLEVR
ncbi:hypothetical protein C8Q76DRAFT_620295 [Earliella scabrosa]|nr:hypothetical protein C8Q76DRAFT_620295 [Earliella scabrosa]